MKIIQEKNKSPRSLCKNCKELIKVGEDTVRYFWVCKMTKKEDIAFSLHTYCYKNLIDNFKLNEL